MNLLKQYLERIRTETLAVVKKLTTAQRISIVLMAIVVALSLILVMSLYTTSDSYATLRTVPDAQTLQSMKDTLEANGIEYREEAEGQQYRLLVPRQDLNKARWHAIQAGQFSNEKNNLDWLFEEPSLLDNQFREKGRMLESKKRELGDTLKWSPNIQNVKIVVEKGRKPIYATSTNVNDTALVSLLLASNVEKLSTREAKTIRLMVQGAFNIPLRNVQIADQRGNSYPFVESSVELTSEENSVQREILATIERIYSHIFLPAQFVAGVLVDVSKRRSTIESVKYESAVSSARSESTNSEEATRGPASPPGVAPNTNASGGLGSAPAGGSTSEKETRTRKDKEFDVRFPESRESTTVPAGEIEGVSVNLVLDEAAVIDMLNKEREARKEQPLEETSAIVQAVGKYVSDQETAIKKLIPASMENAVVHVSTVMFPKPDIPPEVGFVRKTGAWLGGHWKDLALIVIALLGILAAVLMIRRTIPTEIEIPKLEDQLLVQEDRKNVQEASFLQRELDAVKKGHLGIFPQDENPDRDEQEGGDLAVAKDRVAESIEMLNELTREKPHMVTTVLRNWIQDAVKDEV